MNIYDISLLSEEIFVALWIVFGLCLLVEAVCTPWYLKALWPQKCTKSLVLKMICSTMFVSIGVLSMFIADNFSSYAITMLIGLVLGWIGDYFLHAKPSNVYFVTGFASFLIGHFFYIGAYVRALPALFPDYKMLNAPELIIAAVVLVLACVMLKLTKMKMTPKIVAFGIWLYFIILTFMFIKASALGYHQWQSGAEGGIVPFVVLTLGSFFFLLSDASLGVIMFADQRKNYPLKIFNIVTYFWGQIMLASSILFINA